MTTERWVMMALLASALGFTACGHQDGGTPSTSGSTTSGGSTSSPSSSSSTSSGSSGSSSSSGAGSTSGNTSSGTTSSNGSTGTGSSSGSGSTGSSGGQCGGLSSPDPYCDPCFRQSCCAQGDACGANADCVSILLHCTCTDSTCANCTAQFPSGAQAFTDLHNCLQSACPNDCPSGGANGELH